MSVVTKLKQVLSILLITTALALFNSVPALAQNYGCGTYGAGGYNENCQDEDSGGTDSGSGDQTSTGGGDAAECDEILLNDFSEYLSEEGKTLKLKAKQCIYFEVTLNGAVEKHSITIKQIGSDFVIATFASTPTDVRIDVDESVRQDVTEDNQPDIEVTLNSIANNTANMTFKQIASETTTSTTPSPATTTRESDEDNGLPIWIWALAGVIALLTLIVIVAAWRNRRRPLQPGPS